MTRRSKPTGKGARLARPARRQPPLKLSHVDAATGEARMVDVGAKPVTAREAVAAGRILISREAMALVKAGAIKKGDPLQVARLAGILGAKQTAALIPLCHPLPLSGIDVTLTMTAERHRHRGARPHDGADRRRDGSADRRRHRRLDRVRHGQGGR